MNIKVFGHKAPDTDATGSAIIMAWYLSHIKETPATPYILGDLNPETKFVLAHWGVDIPDTITAVEDEDQVVIVDTNNQDELPDNLENAQILQIVDHHRLVGNLKTSYPLEVNIKTMASTASIIGPMMMKQWDQVPKYIKGLILSCILSDTLELRSPTTTECDKRMAQNLAQELELDLSQYAEQMFEAKSDVSDYSDLELVRMDSKVLKIEGKSYRVGVLETASPKVLLDRKEALMVAQAQACEEEDLEEAFLFVIDILNEEATLLVPNQATKTMAEKSFDCKVEGDTVVLPGIVSRKKQIIPALTL